MNLRRQLILVSLLLLALPWAGCQYVREVESTLRQGQAQSLEATAQAIAASFRDQTTLLYPWPERLAALPDASSHMLYASAVTVPVLIDGYADSWPEGWSGQFSHGSGTNAVTMRYRAATRNGQIYLLLDIEDNDVIYDNPALSSEANGDRLLLQTWQDGRRQEYVIATAAPGSVRARYSGRRHPGAQAQRIHGFWQDTQRGYMLELELPLAMTGGRLGLMVVNVGHRAGTRAVTAGNFKALDTAAPPWLVYSPQALQIALDAFAGSQRQIQVFDYAGQRLASTETIVREPEQDGLRDTHTSDQTFWLLRALYRRILSDETLAELPTLDNRGVLQATELTQALAGHPATHWYRDESASSARRATLSAAAPIYAEQRVIGAVILRQSGEEYLSLTDRAFSSMLGYSLLGIGIAAIGLLAYASWLSWRIGRLSRAAGTVVNKGTIQLAAFPRSTARDEVGELSRRYADLLGELQAYNEYLRTLSRKLSHELRTPIAVIQSSLDNLELADDSAQQAVYVGRAREGLERLNRILRAMTEASRVEESVRGDPLVTVNLVALLAEVLPAYQGAYPEHRLTLECALQDAPCEVSPDLLVQALDKLIDNAASFAPAGSTIRLILNGDDDSTWQLGVANTGPLLPEALQGRLFEAMVSMRERSGGMHLGLGLYIVKLISEYFGGRASATNLEDGSGVVVTLSLPRRTTRSVDHTG